jgi:hypothetical protein
MSRTAFAYNTTILFPPYHKKIFDKPTSGVHTRSPCTCTSFSTSGMCVHTYTHTHAHIHNYIQEKHTHTYTHTNDAHTMVFTPSFIRRHWQKQMNNSILHSSASANELPFHLRFNQSTIQLQSIAYSALRTVPYNVTVLKQNRLIPPRENQQSKNQWKKSSKQFTPIS